MLLLVLAAIHLVLSVTWLGALGWAPARAARPFSASAARHLERIGALTLVGAGVAIAGASL